MVWVTNKEKDMFTILDFAKDYIFVWEDGSSKDVAKTHSLDKEDPGNWSTGKVHEGTLVGSNHGVTAQALAKFRGVPVSSITKDVMHQLTLEEAAQIALKNYYYAPNFDALPWDAVIASVMDFGWGAGQETSAKRLQHMVGASVDGHVGPGTAKAYTDYKTKHGLEQTAKDWADARMGYYQSLNQAKFGKYMNGWRNRTNYFLPGTPWWKKFNS